MAGPACGAGGPCPGASARSMRELILGAVAGVQEQSAYAGIVAVPLTVPGTMACLSGSAGAQGWLLGTISAPSAGTLAPSALGIYLQQQYSSGLRGGGAWLWAMAHRRAQSRAVRRGKTRGKPLPQFVCRLEHLRLQRMPGSPSEAWDPASNCQSCAAGRHQAATSSARLPWPGTDFRAPVRADREGPRASALRSALRPHCHRTFSTWRRPECATGAWLDDPGDEARSDTCRPRSRASPALFATACRALHDVIRTCR